LTFYVIGDSGGIADPNPQKAVAAALAGALPGDKPAFVYSVGDIVYYNGDPDQYGPQFYEPYAHLPVPFVGIPGNHDGDSSDHVAGSGIASFMANFCAAQPGVPAADPQMEFGRHTETQPYCDWTLNLAAVTIIGVWTNVPSGGVLAASQVAWLASELKEAPTGKPVILALHHPPYSLDTHHGGSAKMGTALDAAFQQAARCPDMVLSGHVHNAQVFTRTAWGRKIVYVVQGNSGYHNRHALASDAVPGMQVASDVVFNYGDDSGWGYLKLTVSGATISGEYVGVAKDGSVTLLKYRF
jgi:hypothetical protein